MDDKELEIIDETIRWIPHTKTKVWDVATTIRKNIDVLEKGERIKLDKKKIAFEDIPKTIKEMEIEEDAEIEKIFAEIDRKNRRK